MVTWNSFSLCRSGLHNRFHRILCSYGDSISLAICRVAGVLCLALLLHDLPGGVFPSWTVLFVPAVLKEKRN